MRATNTLDSSQVDVTQPVMAELHKYDDVLVTSGDFVGDECIAPKGEYLCLSANIGTNF